NGFVEDLREQLAVHDKFKNGWIGKTKGASIQFNIDCKSIAVQFCKSPRPNAPLAKVIIDGDTCNPFIIDASNSTTKGDNLNLQTLIVANESKVHDILIVVDKIEESIKDEFYLASIIVA
ncbi:MAG: hypothetical protein K0S18_1780, partial [Anaerocolumna sp.]|nr:hypothetical protein [Anaerocolumna sp.]